MTESVKIRDLVPNKEYGLQIRGRTIEGEPVGEWSHVFKFTLSGDTVPPPVPPIAVTNHHDTFIVASSPYDYPADFNKMTVMITNGTITEEYDMDVRRLNYPLELNTADFGEPEHTLTFTVRAYDNAGNFSESVDVEHTIPEPPPPVLTANEHTGVVELKWTLPDGSGGGGEQAPVYLLSSYIGGTGEDENVIYKLDSDLGLVSSTVTTPAAAPNDAPSYWGLAMLAGKLWTTDQNHTSVNALAALDPDTGVAESWAVTVTHDFLSTDLTVHDGMVLVAADDDDVSATNFFYLMWFDVSSEPPTEERVETIVTEDGSQLEVSGITVHNGTIMVTGHERVSGSLGDEYLWDVDLVANEAINKRLITPTGMDVPGVTTNYSTASQSIASNGESILAVNYPFDQTWLYRWDTDGTVLSVHLPGVPANQCNVWATP